MKAPAWLVGLREAAASLLFSAHCPVCASSVETPGSWCAPCLSRTVRPHRLTLSKEALAAIDDAWAVGFYGSALGALIRALKYRGRRAAIPYIRTALSAAELPLTGETSEYLLTHIEKSRKSPDKKAGTFYEDSECRSAASTKWS